MLRQLFWDVPEQARLKDIKGLNESLKALGWPVRVCVDGHILYTGKLPGERCDMNDWDDHEEVARIVSQHIEFGEITIAVDSLDNGYLATPDGPHIIESAYSA